MKTYFLRRLLLVPITLLGVTLIVFSLTRIMPGSPMEQAMQKQNQGDEGGSSSSDSPQGNMSEDDLEKLEEEFDYDKVIPVAYLNWLGALPRERDIVKKEIPTQQVTLNLKPLGAITFSRRGDQITAIKDAKGEDFSLPIGWNASLLPPQSLQSNGKKSPGYLLKVTSPKTNTENLKNAENAENKKIAAQEATFPALRSGTDNIDITTDAQLVLFGSGQRILVKVDANDPTKILSSTYMNATDRTPEQDGWKIIVQTPEDRRSFAARRTKRDVSEVNTPYEYRIKAYKTRFEGLFQGSFGKSVKYGDSVVSMILDRVPISLYFGILSTVIIYGVCIPLGIMKGIRHRSLMDNLTSILIFVGYSIPGFALGALLLVYLGARQGLFPLFGLMSADAENMSLFGQLLDLAHHTVLPLIAYIVSGFAMMTMMMKNNLMDNLSADYVRTAVAKGVSFNGAVFKHAFRNSFIPIATGLGGLITIFVGGSLLIEKVFDIQGFGMLSFNAVEQRDQTVIMGTLTISAFLMMIGNILSDLIVSMVDPRIKFSK